ncbi:MAG: nitroreductase family protein [Acidobacteriota bacterium]
MNRRYFLFGGGGVVLAGAGAAAVGLSQAGAMAAYNTAVASARAGLSAEWRIEDCLRFATLAANGHNTQPWRFHIGEDRVEIQPDLTRRTPVVDPDDHHLFVSLGCAAENLSLAAGARGRTGELQFNPAGDGGVALVFGSAPAADPALVDAIPRRQSTRAEYDGSAVTAGELRTLAAAAVVPGVDLVLVTERAAMNRLGDLVIAGNTAQMADAAFVRELKTWLRFNPRDALATGDGLFSAASGSPALPGWLGRRAFDLVFRAAAENDKYARQLRTSAGLAVFVTERADKEHWVRAGRACQRFALQATALGLKHAFVNQPVEVSGLRPELAALVGTPGRRPDIVMRFGRGAALPYAPRRPVAAVLA